MQIPAAKISFSSRDRAAILRRIDESLSTGDLTLGRWNGEFERRFAECVGVKYAVAVSSGTSALEILLRIFEVSGKEVVVPTNTFFATPAAVLHAGGLVRFADIDPASFAMDPGSLRRAIGPRTAGAILVHIGGIITPRVAEIRRICRERGLFLLEDAAHAHGCSYNGAMAGTFGAAGSFSFYPTKVMTCAEGGMIVTNDRRINDEARIYRDQGKAGFGRNHHVRLGYNWRMSELHAAAGISQLERLPAIIRDRTRAAALYVAEAPRLAPGLRLALPPKGCVSNYYKLIALPPDDIDRDALKPLLRAEGVSLSGEVYETPCHLQPVFRASRSVRKTGPLPAAEVLCRRHVCLPIYLGMRRDEIRHVLRSLGRCFEALRRRR